MDEVSNSKVVKDKDKPIAFGLYDADDASAPWMILSNNNNNNDDATRNMEKVENDCDFDYFPMQMNKKNLHDQHTQCVADGLNIVDDGKLSEGELVNVPEEMASIDKEVNVKKNEIETDDDVDDDNNNDNNDTSFENLSYISEEENLGVIDDIVFLPNNLYSEDEMSNSDDCIYAYRGVDFEPIRSSPEDENDFLEMDFEPDPSSEIEQDGRTFRLPNVRENRILCSSDMSNRMHPDLALANVDIRPNEARNQLNTSPSGDRQKFGEKTSENESSRCQRSCVDCECSSNTVDATTIESNGREDNVREADFDSVNESMVGINNQNSSSIPSTSSTTTTTAEASAPNAVKKYTGTIPKTNRNYLNLRSNRSKVTSTAFGPTKIHREITNKSYPLYMCKRWKDGNYVPDATACQKSDENLHSVVSSALQTGRDSAKIKSNTKRSMSFPFEGFMQTEQQCNIESKVVPATNPIVTKMHSSQSQIHLSKQDDDDHVSASNGQCHGGRLNDASVTIFTGNCTVDAITAALSQLDIRVNLRKLTASFPHINEIETMQMDVAEYLIHMSKLYCDFKAIKNAILTSHEDEDLDIEFIPVDRDDCASIQIPVKEILVRLRQNSNLFDILAIRSRRFHKFNVLGQVVDAVRKFRNKHLDSTRDIYITIPQYYQNGYLAISRN